MMTDRVLILTRLPEVMLSRLAAEFPHLEFIDARETATLEKHLADAAITYGLPAVDKLEQAAALRWIQLTSAGVPHDLCPVAARRNIKVTNLAGLFLHLSVPHPFSDVMCTLSVCTG